MIDKQQAIQKGIKILDNTENSNSLFAMLQTRFPETIKDGQVSLKAIATLLGKDLSNMQGYELTFTGKGLANALYTTPCQKVLKHKETFNASSQNSKTKNTIIIGDNLDALKVLKTAYSEKIKMIYIDPPYNTGGDNFIYPDDFREDYKEILREVGLIEIDEEGKEVESETLQFFKNITGSKSHSGWLSFMLPRLKLARDLLREDGVIFISIDDNEQANLKLLCDEIFGEENFVADFIVVRSEGGGLAKQAVIGHDYLLCYSKSILNFIPLGKPKDIRGKIVKIDNEDYWIETDWLRKEFGKYGTCLYEDLIGKRKEEIENGLKNGSYTLIKKGDKHIVGRYRKVKTDTSKFYTILKHLNKIGNDDLETLGLNKVFSFPKPISLIKELICGATISNPNNNDLILDFFAGSGTTAQAVMELNAEDKGNRQFILVQLDEPINEDKSKVAYDFCKNELYSPKPCISDITIERVKRAGAKIAKEHILFQGDLGFNVYTLCKKPSLVYNEEGYLGLLTGRKGMSPSDIARNLSLQCGKGLDRELECIIESKLYKCDDVYCVVEYDKEVLEILRNTKNEYIFIDGYASLELEEFLNLKNSADIDERLRIVY